MTVVIAVAAFLGGFTLAAILATGTETVCGDAACKVSADTTAACLRETKRFAWRLS